MYVMGNYPKCYVQVDESNTQLICDPRVYKVNDRFFRTASITKTPGKSVREIQLLRKELAVLHAIAKLPTKLQSGALDELEELKDAEDTELEERRKEENEDSTPDIDPDVLKKRRLEEDRKREFPDPDDAKLKAELESMNQTQYSGKRSILEYKTASLDSYFKKLNYRIAEPGDKFLMELGCS